MKTFLGFFILYQALRVAGDLYDLAFRRYERTPQTIALGAFTAVCWMATACVLLTGLKL